MSFLLWQFFLHDDLESFKQLLASANYAQSNRAGVNIITGSSKFGSPGGAAAAVGSSSPSNAAKAKRSVVGSFTASPLFDKLSPFVQNYPPVTLTRADVNARDQYGRTLLHLVASSSKESALEFAQALLTVPFLDVYAQDTESGWTALHRALYAGNAAIAQALFAWELKSVKELRPSGGSAHVSGGLIKIKDREGNSPLDLFNSTLSPRHSEPLPSSDLPTNSANLYNVFTKADRASSFVTARKLMPFVSVSGNEVLTFGSNKNLSLGLGDGDDRQFPVRVQLTRPDHLLFRLYREQERNRGKEGEDFEPESAPELPIRIRCKPFVFEDVAMSKLHTAIITDDPESNLHICGFGPGGRLGTGDEETRFHFVCIESGGLAGKKIVSVALGQDHTIAISDRGEVFSWGSNKFGQLGYSLPQTNRKDEFPIQTTPKQVFNPLKKEFIIAAAASSIHSVVYTSTSIYTFGKNEGQLGLIDADARSLEVQTIPRKVGASLFSQTISMVSAIDRATAVLMENHDVWVFTHYGYSKIGFPFAGPSSFIRDSFSSTKYGYSTNHITKISSGGNTICAMSRFGEAFTLDVNRKPDIHSVASSTTNPSKVRNLLPPPTRVWSIRKSHMAVQDVDVGQDGSIIICTNSGSAWRKEPRTRLKDAGSNASGERQTKDYKFVRIPGLSRAVTVRSNAFGAYAAIQRGYDVVEKQIHPQSTTFMDDIWRLSPFKDYRIHCIRSEDPPPACHAAVIKGVLPDDLKPGWRGNLERAYQPFPAPVWVSTTSCSDIQIPVHNFILLARSSVLRQALAEFHLSYYYSIPDLLSIEYNKDGEPHIKFEDIDILSLFNFVYFLYADRVYGIWNQVEFKPQHALYYRKIRTEVIKIAGKLNLKTLEQAARLMTTADSLFPFEMEDVISDASFFESGDVIIELSDAEIKAHSPILCERCPFFDGLFEGRSGGRWLSSRTESSSDCMDPIRVDLKHIESSTFNFVMRHIYADTDESELFEDVQADDLDDFIDLLVDVMFTANELMLDRLAGICQALLGSYVDIRNVVPFLNTVAPCSVTAFKTAALEYICLNLEVMLENRLLDDLDPELFDELNAVCRSNQIDLQPISRHHNTEEYFVGLHPETIPQLEQDKKRRVDSMKLRFHLHEDEWREDKMRVGSIERQGFLSPTGKSSLFSRPLVSKTSIESPCLRAKASAGDLIFAMDDENSPLPSSPDLTNMNNNTPTRTKENSPRVTSGSWQRPNSYQSPNTTPVNYPIPTNSIPQSLALPPPALSGSQQSLKPLPERPAGAPWGSFTRSTQKSGLRDIMAETSGSNTPAPNAFPCREIDVPKPVSSRLSQKERKKMKQQQLQDTLVEAKSPKLQPQSPWKLPPAKEKTPIRKQDSEPSIPQRTSSRTSLNLRQTVAGTPPPPPSFDKPDPSSSFDQKSRSSQVTASVNTAKTSTTPSFSNSTPLSLAAILEQQQFEKDVIREAATAKHNLHDIQVEQEFQQWWDAESKRVMEEEAAAAAAAVPTSTSSRTRGHGRGRGRGRTRGGGTGDSGRIHSSERNIDSRNTSHNGTTDAPSETLQSNQPFQPQSSSNSQPRGGKISNDRGRGAKRGGNNASRGSAQRGRNPQLR